MEPWWVFWFVFAFAVIVGAAYAANKFGGDFESCPNCGLSDNDHDEQLDVAPCPVCKRKGMSNYGVHE